MTPNQQPVRGDKSTEVAMQTRCIYCKMEQYGPAVHAISYGLHPCVWCGKTPPVLTYPEYNTQLKAPVKEEPNNTAK
jgi:hypothetical protein